MPETQPGATPRAAPTPDPVGRHLLADLSGLEAALLRDPDPLLAALEEALVAAGFTVLETTSHRFESGGEGFTAIALLAESHAAVHTYPEHGYLALDVFSCGPADPAAILEALVERLGPSSVTHRTVERGPGR